MTFQPKPDAPSAGTGGAGTSAHFEALVESSEDAILSKDTSGVITSWNPAAVRLYGYAPEEAIGQRIRLIIPDDHADEEAEILGRVLEGKRLAHYETERVRKDGRRVSVSLTVSPIIGAEDEITGASVVAHDISNRVRARERAALLQGITSDLGRAAEPEQAIDVLLRAGIDVLDADAASLGLLDPSGRQVELAGSIRHSEQLSRWTSFPLDTDVPMCRAIQSLETIWSSTPEDLAERFPPLAGEEIRFDALAVLPLAVEGKALGAVSFSFASPRQFSAEERAFTGAIVQQAAFNLERAKVFEAERQARRRVSFVARASEVLNESLDTTNTLERLADLAVTHISDWCAVDMVNDDGETVNVVTAHIDRSKSDLAADFRRRFPPDPDGERGLPAVIRTGRSELYEEISEELMLDVAQSDEHMLLIRELGLVSAMVVPLTARGRTLGALTFASSHSDRHFDADDLLLAEDLARRAATAIDTSSLYEREHETALTLQRALLPEKLPEARGVEAAARYLPAEAGLEVGGDWFDLIVTDQDRIDLVIGDVSGRGVGAAAVMGRLAIAVRAFTLDGRPVERVVGGVNRLLSQLASPQIATLFQLSLEASSGKARYVRAGHLPALLRTPGGEVVELSGDGAPPIGWLAELDPPANELSLEPGSTLLLYTDGLIERRGSDLGVGIESLKAELAKAPDDPEGIVEAIPAAMGAERVHDDIALLAVRLTG